ncbi:shootin-1 [Anabrus simplex]|uniref:shootin-1 n=1 Tax=Anabrus simplex TaxID=316456 RepID=UPI0035A33618
MSTSNINFHNSPSSPGVYGGRVRAMATSYSNGTPTSPSHIPLPKYTSTFRFSPESPTSKQSPQPVQQSEQNNVENRWKVRYEEAERRRKQLLAESQKVARDHAYLERKYKELINELNNKQLQFNDKDEQLNKLRKVSEALITEYEKLKNKYEVETGAMHSAMKTASQWYSQNRELKRKSAVLAQKFLEVSPSGILDLDDDTDASSSGSSPREDDELAGLRNTVKELSEEVARLQTDLKAARLLEFEAQEQIVNLSAELEEERTARSRAEEELNELRVMKQNMGHVSKLVVAEMTSLREKCEQEREVALRMKNEADVAQKERNVLAHQSTLLLSDIAGDEKFLLVIQEVESLKRQIEEERQKHNNELQDLQEKLDQREADAQIELLEEKLKLSESELQCALQRAERAETQSNELNTRVSQLEDELQTLKCPPPPPPPPLPPPPAVGNFSTPIIKKKLTTVIDSSRVVEDDATVANPVLDMANMLGIPRKPTSKITPTQSGAIDDIINQIKGGRFTLKTTEKQQNKKEEPPAAVQEMLNILGTLKRRAKSNNSTKRSPHVLADVAL